MLWVKLVSDVGQGVIAKMNLTQFIFAIHKCIFTHMAMKNCAKWTYVRAITLLFKTNLTFLKCNLRKRTPKAGDRLSCRTGQVVVIARLVSHFLQKRTLEEGEWVGDSFRASPSALCRDSRDARHRSGLRWGKLAQRHPVLEEKAKGEAPGTDGFRAKVKHV